jgi:multidrug efflux system membrane fusion protein
MKRSLLLAAGLALALVLWLASGQPVVQRWFVDPPAPSAAADAATAPSARRTLPRVRVVASEARPIAREIVVYGRTEPERDVVIRAETFGRVEEVRVEKGERVAAGDVILRLDAREREAMVEQAEALVDQRALEFRAATQLGARGFQAETAVAAAAAALSAARAELREREVALANTTVTAAFDGLLADRVAEIGDYVDTGDELAHLLQDDPFLATGEIVETDRRRVELGMAVDVELADGQRHEGRLSFIDAVAEEATRTFRIEVTIPNADGRIPAGMSATLRLHFAETMAHRVSASLLSLSEDHRLGVKVVDGDDVVRFVPVEIVRADAEAVWLAGLPERCRLIVVGQGFVHAGEQVAPSEVAAEAAAFAEGGV